MIMFRFAAWAAVLALAAYTTAFAQKKYDAGASDTEIRIGNTAPYSGVLSNASSGPKAMKAYFVQATVQVIRQTGDDLTHENIMKHAANLDVTLPMLLPGINVKTSADDYFPLERMKMMRFTGTYWELFGKVYGR